MRIFDLKQTKNCGNAVLSVSVESQRLGCRTLWFSLPEAYSHYLCTTRLDGFLVGLLYPAMQVGEDIHLEGCVSRRLLFNLNNYVVPLLMSFSPSCKPVKMTADQTSSERFEGSGVGTGFSGGVDSFCTIYDRYELETCPDHKINTLVFLNVGSHGPGQTEDELGLTQKKFYHRYQYLKAYPEEISLDFIPENSNLHSFYIDANQNTHTIRSASALLILQNFFYRHYYASAGIDYRGVTDSASWYRNIDIGAYCDSILLPLLSTESLDFLSDGVQYTRSEKILRIINHEPVRRYLNVCVSEEMSHKNCSICSKCCRTLMALESMDKLNVLENLFDIEKYRTVARRQFMRQQILLKSKDPLAYDNVDLAKRNNVKLPHLIVCYAFWCKTQIKAFRKKLKKIFRKFLGFQDNILEEC